MSEYQKSDILTLDAFINDDFQNDTQLLFSLPPCVVGDGLDQYFNDGVDSPLSPLSECSSLSPVISTIDDQFPVQFLTHPSPVVDPIVEEIEEQPQAAPSKKRKLLQPTRITVHLTLCHDMLNTYHQITNPDAYQKGKSLANPSMSLSICIPINMKEIYEIVMNWITKGLGMPEIPFDEFGIVDDQENDIDEDDDKYGVNKKRKTSSSHQLQYWRVVMKRAPSSNLLSFQERSQVVKKNVGKELSKLSTTLLNWC